MSQVRQDFIERISIFKSSLNTPNTLDQQLNNVDHNNIAKLLRNGLAVVGFVALEDFIKNRTYEVLCEIASSQISFNNLTDELKKRTIVVALESIYANLKFQDDKISYVQSEAKIIASSLLTNYQLNKHAFGYKSFNMNDEEVSSILKAFYVKRPWQEQTLLSSHIGLTTLDLTTSFKNAMNRRHSAAHDVSCVIPTGDLVYYVKEAIAIALTFDALLVSAKNKLINDNYNFINNKIGTVWSEINLSRIQKQGNKWKYKRDSSKRALKTNSNLELLINDSVPIALANHECLLVYNEMNEIVAWYI